MVCTYDCKEGIRGVMIQEGYVNFCESRKLNDHEKNYVTQDLEFAIILHALNFWMHNLLGRRFVLMKNHGEPRYLFDQPNLSDIHPRWLALISESHFEKNHIKGK